MSVLIIDKETNKQITVATGETNTRSPPMFSGTGRTQDPLRFLEDFEKVSKWNNWRTDERKKETFLLCLTGHAERWMKNHLMNDMKTFETLLYDDGTENCILSKFKENYITEEWYELYTKHYEERTQTNEETPLEFMEIKRYLMQRAGPDCIDRTEKQKVRDIMKGLLPQVRIFCEKKLKDPFNKEAKKTLDGLDGLEKLLRWAESCLYEDRKVLNVTSDEENIVGSTSVNAVRRFERNNSRTDHSSGTANNNKANMTDFERLVLAKLEKLDLIENELAMVKDRVDMMEKNNAAQVGQSSYPSHNGNHGTGGNKLRCYNCDGVGHFARNCNSMCNTCERANHSSFNCPKRNQENGGEGQTNNSLQESKDFQNGPLHA